jgi:hypothetical protein
MARVWKQSGRRIGGRKIGDGKLGILGGGTGIGSSPRLPLVRSKLNKVQVRDTCNLTSDINEPPSSLTVSPERSSRRYEPPPHDNLPTTCKNRSCWTTLFRRHASMSRRNAPPPWRSSTPRNIISDAPPAIPNSPNASIRLYFAPRSDPLVVRPGCIPLQPGRSFCPRSSKLSLQSSSGGGS